MTSRRMITSEFWKSETMAQLSFRQRLLFIGLFSNADDQGRIRGNPGLIRSTIFPLDNISWDDIKTDLAAIEQVGSIHCYSVDGKDYIQIPGWWKYQQPQWAYPSNIPAPAGWSDRLRYRKDNKILTENWDTPTNDFLPNPLPKDLPKGEPNASGGPVVLGLGLGLREDLANEALSEPQEQDEPETSLAADAADNFSSSPRKPRKPSEKDLKRQALQAFFLEKSGVPGPNPKASVKEVNKLWWSPLREILGWVDWNEEEAKILVEEAVSKLRERGWIVSSPNSLLKTAQSLFGERNGCGYSLLESQGIQYIGA